MSVISSAIAHFSDKAVRTIDVKEWGAKFYSKNLTLDDKAKMLNRANGSNVDYLCYVLIFGLTDEKGDPVFTLEDKAALKQKVDPDIVSRLSSFVLDGTKSESDREKN